MNVERWGLGCAVSEAKIFAVGGKRHVREYQNTVEIYVRITTRRSCAIESTNKSGFVSKIGANNIFISSVRNQATEDG